MMLLMDLTNCNDDDDDDDDDDDGDGDYAFDAIDDDERSKKLTSFEASLFRNYDQPTD